MPPGADEGAARDHWTRGCQAERVVIDQRCGSVPRATRVLTRHERSRLSGCTRSSHADWTRLASRIAPQAGYKTYAAVPALSHARRKAAAQTRGGLRAGYRDHSDLHRGA